MRKVVRILIPWLAFLAPFANAQNGEKKYRLEFFGGANLPLNKHFEIGSPQSNVTIKASQDFSVGPQGGMRFGIDGRKYWGQDYTYSFGTNSARFVSQYGRFSYRNQFHQANTSILFYPWSLNRHQVYPYVLAGLGATFVIVPQHDVAQSGNPFQPSVGPLKSETIFAFHAGFGVRFRLSERFGIRIDGRDYISRALRYGLPKTSSDPNTPVLPIAGVFHQLAGTFSFVVHF